MMDAAPHRHRAGTQAGSAVAELRRERAPRTHKPGILPGAAVERRAPVILRVAHAAEIADATALGGNFLLLADDALLDAAKASGLGLLREISLHRAAFGDALLDPASRVVRPCA